LAATPPAAKIATLQDRTLTLKVNQAALVRGGDRFCPAHDVQLVENASHVGLHGRFADEKIRADLFIASAASKKFENIDFTAGQRFTAHARNQFGSERGGYAGFASMHLSNRIQQFLQEARLLIDTLWRQL